MDLDYVARVNCLEEARRAEDEQLEREEAKFSRLKVLPGYDRRDATRCG